MKPIPSSIEFFRFKLSDVETIDVISIWLLIV